MTNLYIEEGEDNIYNSFKMNKKKNEWFFAIEDLEKK